MMHLNRRCICCGNYDYKMVYYKTYNNEFWCLKCFNKNFKKQPRCLYAEICHFCQIDYLEPWYTIHFNFGINKSNVCIFCINSKPWLKEQLNKEQKDVKRTCKSKKS